MRDEVLAHYRKFLGDGRIFWKNTEDKFPIDLVQFPVHPASKSRCFATIGLSEFEVTAPAGAEDQRRKELLIYLPPEMKLDAASKAPGAWAYMILFFTARSIIEKNVFLTWGSVIHTEESRPREFARFPYVMVVPPLGEVPDFFPFRTSSGEVIQFCVLQLITQREADFLKKNGQKALVEKMIDRDTIHPMMRADRPCTFAVPGEVSKPSPVLSSKLFDEDAHRENQAEERALQSGQTGCILGVVIFLGMLFFLCTPAINSGSKNLLWYVVASFVVPIVFTIGYMLIFVRKRPAKQQTSAPPRPKPTAKSRSAPSDSMDTIDNYLMAWDDFALGDNAKIEIINANKDAFENALSQALAKRDRRAPGRLVFLAVVMVGAPIGYNGKLGTAFRKIAGDVVPHTDSDGEPSYFPGDIYFWWVKNKDKFEAYPLLDDWLQRDFAKQTVIPMYERVCKRE